MGLVLGPAPRPLKLRVTIACLDTAASTLATALVLELFGVPFLARIAAAALAGFVVGRWNGRAVALPYDELRARIVPQATRAAPGAGLERRRADEVGELASSFDALLVALRRRSRANQSLFSDLAHDLKNPIAAIRAAADSLARGAGDDPRVTRHAALFQDASRRLDESVTHFVELARAEAGLIDEERDVVDLAALARGLGEALRAEPRHAQVAFEVDAAGPRTVVAVASRLESALRGVIDHGASAAGPGGKVSISLDEGDRAYTLTVRDTGPAFPAEHPSHVFDAGALVRGGSGGKLDLAFARAVVEAHGGSISATNDGGGATVTLKLPKAP